jgi:hypothetical protein
MTTNFDSKEAYNQYIKDEVKKLNVLCRVYKIPFYMTFAVSNNNEGTEYVSVAGVPNSMNCELKDDRVRKMILLQNGFEVTPKVRPGMFLSGPEETDTSMMTRIFEEAENEVVEPFTEEELEYAKQVKEEADKKKTRGLGRPKGSTKAAMEKKRAEENRKDFGAYGYTEEEDE